MAQIGVGAGGISVDLVKEAQKALKNDGKIEQKEYDKLKEVALKSGGLDKNEQLFIASLDDSSMIEKLTKADFDPAKPGLKFELSAKEEKYPILTVDGNKYHVGTISEKATLSKNLAAGSEIMQNIAGSIVSSNTSNYAMDALAFLPNVFARVRTMATSPDPKLDAPPKGINAGSDYKEVHHIARVAKEHAVGNCGEKAAATAIDMADKGMGPVEVFIIEGHAFSVVGRDPASPLNDPTKWGPTAVIVDAWYGEAYPAKDIAIHMDNKGKVPETSLVYSVSNP